MSVVRELAAEALLVELKAGGSEQWYYISIVHVPTNVFYGGCYVRGYGPTDAWLRVHGLNLIGHDCETQTHGPIPDGVIAEKVPEGNRWRRLALEEVKGEGT